MKITHFASIEIPGHAQDSFDEIMLGRKGLGERSRGGLPKADEQPDGVEQILEAAQDCYFRGYYLEGLKYYARALSHDINIIQAWVGQVRILIDVGRFNGAVYWAEKACETLGCTTSLSFVKALALAHAGRIDDARKIINVPVNKDEDPLIWLLRGEVLIKMKINIFQKLFTPHKSIGRLGAFFCFIKALESDQHDPFMNQRIGLAYMLERQYGRAAEHLSISANGVSDNPLTLYGIAECYRARKDYERALRYVKKAIAGNPHLDCAFDLLEWLHEPGRSFYWVFKGRKGKEAS